MFDQELVAQVVAVGGLRIGEIAVPTRYFEEASSVGFRRSVVYGLSTLRVVGTYLLHRTGLRRSASSGRGRAVRESGDRLTVSRRGVGRAVIGIGDLDRRALLVVRSVDLAATGPITSAAAAVDRRDGRVHGPRHRAAGAPLAGAAAPGRRRPVPAHAARPTSVGYLANNILPARLGELVRTDDLGSGPACHGSTILGTIVVERVVDTVVLVAIAVDLDPRAVGARDRRFAPCSSASP